jgi:hypothetical protein
VETQACAFIIPLALVFLLILLVLSLELHVVYLLYGVYETMLYVLYVPCGTLWLFTYVFVSSWYMFEMAMFEMAMELLSGISLLSYSEFHND